MTKAELTTVVAKKAGIRKEDAFKAINAMFEAIPEALNNGETIQLAGFGTFKVKVRPAHVARNPATGESVNVPEKTVKVFKFSKSV